MVDGLGTLQRKGRFKWSDWQGGLRRSMLWIVLIALMAFVIERKRD